MKQATGEDWLVLPPWHAEEEEGSHTNAMAPMQVAPSALEQLLEDHRRLLADIQDFRADFDVLVNCVEKHGIEVPARLSSKRLSKPSVFEEVLELPKLAAGVFVAAGQLAWSASRRMSKSTCRNATAVQETRLFVVGGCYQHSVSRVSSVESLDLRSGQWEAEPQLAQTREGHVAAVLGGNVYVCGGNYPQGHSVVHFNFAHRRWAESPPMKKSRCWAMAITMNGIMYVIGGRNTQCVEDTIECFCPVVGTAGCWAMVLGKPMHGRYVGAAIALQGNRALMCGGVGKLAKVWQYPVQEDRMSPFAALPKVTLLGLEVACTAEIFEFSSNTSKAIGHLLHPRIHHKAVTVNGKVVVLGGAFPNTGCALGSAEVYHPSSDSWLACPELFYRTPLGGMQCHVIYNSLYILGGHSEDVTGTVAESSVQKLDLATGLWQDWQPNMMQPRAGFGSAVITCGPTKAT